MKNRPYLFFIKSAQTNYQSFFCLLFFSKKSMVPTFFQRKVRARGVFGRSFQIIKTVAKGGGV